MASGLRGARVASLDLMPAHDCTWEGQATWSRTGRALSWIVTAGLLMTYLVGWAQDLQRLSRLEAEPSPPYKIITKQEAWQRIHPPVAR